MLDEILNCKRDDRVKKILSLQHSFELDGQIHKRLDLEAKCRENLSSVFKTIHETLNGEQVVDVIVTGGCAKIPMLKDALEQFFQGRVL